MLSQHYLQSILNRFVFLFFNVAVTWKTWPKPAQRRSVNSLSLKVVWGLCSPCVSSAPGPAQWRWSRSWALWWLWAVSARGQTDTPGCGTASRPTTACRWATWWWRQPPYSVGVHQQLPWTFSDTWALESTVWRRFSVCSAAIWSLLFKGFGTPSSRPWLWRKRERH